VLLSGVICLASTQYSSLALAEELAPPSSNGLTPWRLGMLLPLSGPYAPVGEDCKRGVQVAMQASTGAELRYSDSQADPKLSMSEFEKLIRADKVDAVLAVRGPVGMAVNPLSAKSFIPLLGAVGHAEFAPGNPYAFQFWPSADIEGGTLAQKIYERSLHSVAVLTGEDEWLVSVSDWFTKNFSQRGGKVLVSESISPTTQDFQSEVLRIRAARPEAVFLNVAISQIGPLTKRLKEQGVTAAIYSNFWVAKPEVLASVPADVLEDVRFIEARLSYPLFRAELEKLTGTSAASGMTYSCYSAVSAFLQASGTVKPAGSQPQRRAALYEALLGLTEIQLLDSKVTLLVRKAQFELTEKRIRSGRVDG
jgi:ABC-type branched-subunit amino acid transport system substrate-binding protein